MDDCLTTQELCAKLGVASKWIQRHLRENFGEKKLEGDPKIYYSESQILAFFNEQADFARQLAWAKEEEIGEAYRIPESAAWNRGRYPWIKVSVKIQALDDLYTMEKLSMEQGYKAPELIYRELFRSCAIRVRLCGRTWFMRSPCPGKGYIATNDPRHLS